MSDDHESQNRDLNDDALRTEEHRLGTTRNPRGLLRSGRSAVEPQRTVSRIQLSSGPVPRRGVRARNSRARVRYPAPVERGVPPRTVVVITVLSDPVTVVPHGAGETFGGSTVIEPEARCPPSDPSVPRGRRDRARSRRGRPLRRPRGTDGSDGGHRASGSITVDPPKVSPAP
jgi:hypothetical protein